MLVRIVLICLVLACLSCSKQDVQDGLFDYQVERLLSGGSSKTWDEVINSTDCQDSLRFLIQLVEDQEDDSLSISQITTSSSNCTNLDTAFIGLANASSFGEGFSFSDSLIFSDGNVWIINDLTSQILSINTGRNRSFRSSE